MRTLRRLTIAAVLSVTAFVADAGATTVLQVDIPDLTATSEWIVDARVLKVEDVDLRPAGGLFTDVTLAFDAVLKGDRATPATYVLRLPGGVGADGMAMVVPGMPRFRVGERVVLFLERTSAGHVPCGLGQGVWRVTSDQRGVDWVQQSAGDLHLVRRTADGRVAPAAPAQRTEVSTLRDLATRVQEAQRRAVRR